MATLALGYIGVANAGRIGGRNRRLSRGLKRPNGQGKSAKRQECDAAETNACFELFQRAGRIPIKAEGRQAFMGK